MANYKSLEAHCQDYNLYSITNLIATVVFGCPISTHVRPRRCWYAKNKLLTFQLIYQNKSCSECQKDVRKIERQTDRQTDRKTKRLFSLVIRTKVVKNVNRMSEK